MEQKKRTKKLYDSKVFWMIVSLLCSLVMWAYVSSLDSTDKEITVSGIAVEFRGQDELLADRSLSIASVDTETVSIVVRGERSNITKLRSSDIKAVIDVSNITQPNDMTWGYKLEFPDYVDANSITVVRKNPETINFTVVRNAKKTVEVKGSFEGTIAEGCVAEEFVFEPGTIVVEGPEASIEKIDHAWVTFGKNQTIESTYSEEAAFILMDADDNPCSKEGLMFSVDTIKATQPILKSKEVPLRVNLISGGGITAADCTVSIDPQTIKIAGDSRIVDDLDFIEIGAIDLSSFVSGYEHTFTIELEEGIQNLTGVSEAKVIVEVEGTSTKTFTTTNISCRGVSSGYNATIDTKEVEVTLRALSSEVLKSITADDISVIADLSDYGATTGQVIVNAKVLVSGYDNVGAIGEVRVTVTIYKE